MGESRTSPDLAGRLVAGRYQVLRLLGRGGMGAVWLAVQQPLGREVALKVLEGEGAADEVRFLREAQAVARLGHPNIVTVHDFGRTEEGLSYLALERLPGSTLRKDLEERGRTTPLVAREAVAQIARGLAAAHKAGIVHLDLKPENVMRVSPTGAPLALKVLDFGISRFVGEAAHGDGSPSQQRITGGDRVLGTPWYMSPEQVRGVRDDVRSDLYALGVVWFELLAGRPPFSNGSSAEIMAQHLAELPPSIRAVCPAADVDEADEALIKRLLAKDPAARPEDGAALVAELAALPQPAPRAVVSTADAQAPIPPVAAGIRTRRLAALLFMDVAGYSRLMGTDEEYTLGAVEQVFRVARTQVAAHHGVVVKTIGDAVMAEFSSSVNAVRCAVTIHQLVKSEGIRGPGGAPILLRVGIHTGDVVGIGDDVFGDAVNIAARIEGKAEPGGIAVSGAVFEQVRRKVPFELEAMGAIDLKNIAEPVALFRVLFDGAPPAGPTGAAPTTSSTGTAATRTAPMGPTPHVAQTGRRRVAALVPTAAIVVALGVSAGALYLASSRHDEPAPAALALDGNKKKAGTTRIAVFPFIDRTGDPALATAKIGEILADTTTNDLYDLKDTVVVAPQLVRRTLDEGGAGRAAAVDADIAAAVGRQLGADIVVTGDVRKLGETFTVHVDIAKPGAIDGVGGVSADCQGIDHILDVLSVKLAAGVRARLQPDAVAAPAIPPITMSLDAYADYMEGMDLATTQGRFGEALVKLDRAVQRDPEFALAWSEIACTMSWAKMDDEASQRKMQHAMEEAARTMAKLPAPDRLLVEGNLAGAEAFKTSPVDPVAAARSMKAYQARVDLVPDDHWGRIYLAVGHRYMRNDLPAAREELLVARRLNPDYFPTTNELVDVQVLLNDRPAAIGTLRDFLARKPNDAGAHAALAKILFDGGDRAGGQAELKKAITLDPRDWRVVTIRADLAAKGAEP